MELQNKHIWNIIEVVNSVNNLECREKTRKESFVYARCMAMKLIRKHFPETSLSEIGKYMKPSNGSPLNHATVIHAISNKFDVYMTDEIFRCLYTNCETIIDSLFKTDDENRADEVAAALEAENAKTTAQMSAQILELKRQLFIEINRSKSPDEIYHKAMQSVPVEWREDFIKSRLIPYVQMKKCAEFYPKFKTK